MAETQHHEHHHHHLMSLQTHLKVFVALVILTVLTVVAAQFHFGVFNTFIAIFIATVKATLVMGWFMHLKYDGVMNRVIFAAGFFFLLLFSVVCLLDIYTRINPRA
ncbi:MAG: cytochrome C oxidase subunit IV family protein [Bdellovibrionales bacterium]|nr:cytochrome C oxidase subunit IV family protein [Bdellovibrionales bacterium]